MAAVADVFSWIKTCQNALDKFQVEYDVCFKVVTNFKEQRTSLMEEADFLMNERVKNISETVSTQPQDSLRGLRKELQEISNLFGEIVDFLDDVKNTSSGTVISFLKTLLGKYRRYQKQFKEYTERLHYMRERLDQLVTIKSRCQLHMREEEEEEEEEEEKGEMVEGGPAQPEAQPQPQPQEEGEGETDGEDVVTRKRVRPLNDLFRGTTSRESTSSSLGTNPGRANESGSRRRRRLFVAASTAGSSARRPTRRQSPLLRLTPSPCPTPPPSPSLLVPFTPSPLPPMRMASDEAQILISSSSDEERESDAVLERDPFAINNSAGLAAIEDVPSTSGNQTVVPLERNAMELRRKLVENGFSVSNFPLNFMAGNVLCSMACGRLIIR
ncbi:hypothetical protein HOLleu_28079 [Holothuria leucospilota]|uniref:Uncharacterized protein n=1 Tax=Holothuria leucospilota TaxID=206669 RepID=A0A9Q1BRL4_HOLLE|nr:hypothetical protein HOLleu_28079 [Holothuria leucospilota]